MTTTYYWFEFSDRIDRKLLSGEVFTPNAGIYSAPKILRNGESTTMLELVDYLKTAGYIEKNNHADASRSRYWVDGASLMIEPGASAIIDGKKAFPSVAVRFKKDGVAAIRNNDTGRRMKTRYALSQKCSALSPPRATAVERPSALTTCRRI